MLIKTRPVDALVVDVAGHQIKHFSTWTFPSIALLITQFSLPVRCLFKEQEKTNKHPSLLNPSNGQHAPADLKSRHSWQL